MPGLFLIPMLVYLSLHFYLDSTAPLWFSLFFELPLILTYIEIKLRPKGKIDFILRTVRISAYTILITGFLMFIVMLPESLYQAWLRLLDVGKATGMISFAFVYAGGLVSSIACTALLRWKNKIQALLNLLLLCIMVILILHPGFFVFFIFLALLIIKLLIIQKDNPRTVALLSISITLIPALLAAFLFPLLNEEPRGSRLVDNFSMGVQSSVSRVFPSFPVFLQIPGYGYGYDQVRKTGEKPFLTPNIIFTLEGEPGSVFYLRSDVFYSYMKGYWICEMPGTGQLEKAVPNEGTYRKILLTVETDIYTRVLHNSWTRYYELDQELRRLDSLGSYEPSTGIPLSRGDRITLFDSNGKAPLPDEDTLKWQIERSLLLQAELKDSLAGIAKKLEGKSSTQSLRNIKNYLRENFKYTLDTKSSENMVLNFLNVTKEGYCVHFSTSATLLARTLGIPVRLAEGFLVQIPYPENGEIYYTGDSHSVTGYSAHQWPEIFIEGKGWLPWEVTPPFESLGDSLIEEDLSLDEFTREQLQHMGLYLQGGSEEQNDPEKIRLLGIALIILIIPVLIISIILLRRTSGLNGVLKRKIRKADKKYGIPSPDITGWVQWFTSMADYSTSAADRRSCSLTLKYCYHCDSLGRDEKKELLNLVREL
jgi:Transglutaminase-like superfamily